MGSMTTILNMIVRPLIGGDNPEKSTRFRFSLGPVMSLSTIHIKSRCSGVIVIDAIIMGALRISFVWLTVTHAHHPPFFLSIFGTFLFWGFQIACLCDMVSTFFYVPRT